jgi:YgiT-type zinc finger domain-containing protein
MAIVSASSVAGKRRLDEEADMRCVICKVGETAPGTVTVTLQRGNTGTVVRDVPAGQPLPAA